MRKSFGGRLPVATIVLALAGGSASARTQGQASIGDQAVRDSDIVTTTRRREESVTRVTFGAMIRTKF